jgi:HPt (histidine-containing phosphotransfer) domain-containing protein
MDHMMPGMDGIEVTRILRGMGVRYPIVALTANAMPGMRDVYLEAGMDELLLKPVIKSELLTVLTAFLPPEKQTVAAFNLSNGETHEAKEMHNTAFWDAIASIDGLYVEVGLDRVSQQYSIYETSLYMMINEIDQCHEKLTSFLADEKIKDFEILAHSMKGALSSIGAVYSTEQALLLEKAANTGDLNYCQQNLEPFLVNMSELRNGLVAAFALKEEIPMEAIPAKLRAAFLDLTQALKTGDLALIDEGLNLLDTYNESGVGERLTAELKNIEEAIMMMDYEGAVRMMEKVTEQ